MRAPRYPFLEMCLDERRVGERPLDVAKRKLTHEALQAAEGNQARAARILGIGVKLYCNWAKDYRLRPKDRRTA